MGYSRFDFEMFAIEMLAVEVRISIVVEVILVSSRDTKDQQDRCIDNKITSLQLFACTEIFTYVTHIHAYDTSFCSVQTHHTYSLLLYTTTSCCCSPFFSTLSSALERLVDFS